MAGAFGAGLRPRNLLSVQVLPPGEYVVFTPAAWALCCAAVLAGGVLLLVVAPPPRCVSGSCARAALVVPGPLASSGALPGLALERAAASAARRPRPARCPRGHACPRSVGLSPPAPGPCVGAVAAAGSNEKVSTCHFAKFSKVGNVKF